MTAIEVLKKMINEKKPYECYMDDKIKLNALKEALLALEQKRFVWVFTDENGYVSVFNSKQTALQIINKDKNRKVMEHSPDEMVFVNTYGGELQIGIGKEQEQSYLVKKEVLERVGEQK